MENDSIVLSEKELAELTGFKHRSKQCEALVHMDIRFRIAPNGCIKVLRSDILNSPDIERQEPDFDAL